MVYWIRTQNAPDGKKYVPHYDSLEIVNIIFIADNTILIVGQYHPHCYTISSD